MKSNSYKKIITAVAIAIPLLTLITPHFAYAFLGIDVTATIFTVTSWIAELAFAAAGSILTLTGVLLNGTLVATLHIQTIVDKVTAIGIAWRTIRDFSSIFIIFMLLYASIKMILGLKNADLSSLIKNIIIAGLLINFSLFFTRLAVDTSNIISLSFYNAIAPGQDTVASTNGFNGMISSAFNDGGLSNVFMQSLSINKIVGASAIAPNGGGDPNNNRTITLAYAGGTVLMLAAAGSFLFAAVAFAVRLGILILLMAFSPIYFIAMILPQAEQYAEQWKKTLIAMCLFMPVYLFLMYVAVSVINDPRFFDFAKVSSTTGTLGNALVSPNVVGIVLQYIIAFMFINAPMAAAIKIGSDGTDIAVKLGQNAKKWGQGKLTTGSKWVGTNAWRESGGRAANAFSNNERLKNFASKSVLGELALKGTRAAAGDYQTNLDKRTKGRTDFVESLGHDNAKMSAEQKSLRYLKNELAAEKAKGSAADPTLVAELGNSIKSSNENISKIENERKTTYYKKRQGVRGLFYNVADKSQVNAAGAIELGIKEKQLTKAKEKLKETESDIRELQKQITSNQGNRRGGGAGTPNPAQAAKLNGLLTDQSNHTAAVNALEDAIEKLK